MHIDVKILNRRLVYQIQQHIITKRDCPLECKVGLTYTN